MRANTMKSHLPLRTIVGVAVLSLAFMGMAHAASEPADPERQTRWKLYVDSREAFEMKQAQGAKVLLVDVRDPIEIMFTGFAPTVDVVVPFMTANRGKWNEKKSVYQVEKNPRFEADLAKALADRGLDKDAPILLMCRSGGERGAPSANELWGKGYTKVFVVVDGFEGEPVKDGERKNWRLVNGWKNSGLPWGYTLDRSKLPLSDR